MLQVVQDQVCKTELEKSQSDMAGTSLVFESVSSRAQRHDNHRQGEIPADSTSAISLPLNTFPFLPIPLQILIMYIIIINSTVVSPNDTQEGTDIPETHVRVKDSA